LNVGQSHLKRCERHLQLLYPRGVIDVEQPINLLFVNPHAPREVRLSDTAARSALYGANLALAVTDFGVDRRKRS
jgi:hypothetical protein